MKTKKQVAADTLRRRKAYAATGEAGYGSFLGDCISFPEQTGTALNGMILKKVAGN